MHSNENSFHKTDTSGVIRHIKAQVLRLVVPNLGGLSGLLMARQRAVQARDDALAQAQRSLEEDGFAAAVRLMMAGDDGSPPAPSRAPYPYARALPHVRTGDDDAHI